jgi:hypothetical protein
VLKMLNTVDCLCYRDMLHADLQKTENERMYRIALLCTWLVVVTVMIGCGSSESGGGSGSMSDAGAALERENSAPAAPADGGGVANANATAASAPSHPAAAPSQPAASPNPPAVASAPAPAAVDPSLASKRGFDLEDWSNEAAYVLVKADVSKAADAVAGAMQGKVIPNVLGKPADENANQTVVYQLAGHPWSVFATYGEGLEELIKTLSRQSDVLVFFQDDFNGWALVELYRGGEEVEAVHWGGVDEKLGEDADASKWHAEGKFDRTFEGITMTDSFLFRSKLRKVTPADLGKGDAFIDEFLVHHDAYLPDADQMPWFDYDTKLISSPLGAAAFAGVHAVEVAP